jgi:hypothetical protein
MLLTEIQSILNNCISINVKSLKKRSVNYNQIPQEFGIVELRKQIQDNLESFGTNVEIKRNIYSPDKANTTITGTRDLPPIVKTITKEVKIEPPVKQPTPTPTIPPEPVVKPPVVAPTIETPVVNPPSPSRGGGGGGGSRSYYEAGRGFGGQPDIVDRDSIQNIK